jgi:hypothetical protein
MTNAQIMGIKEKSLRGLMVNCFIITFLGGMLFLSQRRHHQQYLL